MCLHLQRRISPLHPDTGLKSPLGLILIKTNLVGLSDIPSEYAEEVDTFRHILALPDPRESMPRSPLLSWGWTTRKAVRSLGQEALLLCSPSARLSKMPHQRWRPVIDLSRINTFLHVEKFKMETPQSPSGPP